MMEKHDEDGLSVTITLPANMDLRAASPLCAQILAVRGRNLTLEASSVEQAGALCLQILHSAQLTWARDGAVIAIVNPSMAFRDAIETLGITHGKIGEWATLP